MRRFTRRKLRKNKRTQRRKKLGVKRGGGGRTNVLRNILGTSKKEKAPIEEAAIEEAAIKIAAIEKSKEIIQSLANLVINNLDEDEKKQICSGEKKKVQESNQNIQLQQIHHIVLWSNGQDRIYRCVFKKNDQMLQNILNNLKSNAGLEIVDLKYDESLVIFDDANFLMGLGRVSSGIPFIVSDINLLLYTMLAVCNEYLKRKKSVDVVYDFTDFVCPRYTSVPVMRESTV